MAQTGTAPVPPAEDALSRLAELRTALERLRVEQSALTVARDAAILQLVAAGLSYEAVAQAAGLTRGRVGQIVQRRSA